MRCRSHRARTTSRLQKVRLRRLDRTDVPAREVHDYSEAALHVVRCICSWLQRQSAHHVPTRAHGAGTARDGATVPLQFINASTEKTMSPAATAVMPST